MNTEPAVVMQKQQGTLQALYNFLIRTRGRSQLFDAACYE
jgi:hypothetical protein